MGSIAGISQSRDILGFCCSLCPWFCPKSDVITQLLFCYISHVSHRSNKLFCRCARYSASSSPSWLFSCSDDCSVNFVINFAQSSPYCIGALLKVFLSYDASLGGFVQFSPPIASISFQILS